MEIEQKEELIEHLKGNGWREYPDQFKKYARCFYKQHYTPTRCHCNDDKDGIQVCIAVSESSYEIDVCGGLKDETWVKVHQWAMPQDYVAGLAMIPRMLRAWEAMNE